VKGRVAVALIVASLVVAGCRFLPSPTPDNRCQPNGALSCTTVGGVPLGELAQSWGEGPPPCKHDCDGPIDVARASLDLRAPGHATVTSIDEYVPDRHALCGDTLCQVSGYLGIFVFTFDDSTAMPIVISCPGIAGCGVIERYGSG
jgi:hypothetical protein